MCGRQWEQMVCQQGSYLKKYAEQSYRACTWYYWKFLRGKCFTRLEDSKYYSPIKEIGKINPVNYKPVFLNSVVWKNYQKKLVKFLKDEQLLSLNNIDLGKYILYATNLLRFCIKMVNIIQKGKDWIKFIYLDLNKGFNKVPQKD